VWSDDIEFSYKGREYIAMKDAEVPKELRADWLHLCVSKQKTLFLAHNQRTLRAKLCWEAGYKPRTPGLVIPLLKPERDLICELSWQAFNHTLHRLAYSDDIAELENYVASGKKWIESKLESMHG
jgi:hypothetical protein